MFVMPAHRLTGLLSAVAMMLLLLVQALSSAHVQASLMQNGHAIGGVAVHEHHLDMQSDEMDAACWQQCLNSCTSHCAPMLAITPAAISAGRNHGPASPNLYQPQFPSGLHRPPID